MKDETGKVSFDPEEQTEVDRIVEERLGREHAKYADYEDTKGILDELNAYGYAGTAKEVRQAVKSQREELQKQQSTQQSIAEVKDQIKTEGTSPELIQMLAEFKKEMKESKAEITELKQEKIAATKAAADIVANKEKFDAKVTEFTTEYPDVDLGELDKDEDFVDFLQSSNANLSLVQIYKRYDKYVNHNTDKAVAKIQSNLDRGTSSGKQKNSAGSSKGLSSSQKEMVDDFNKSCKNNREKITYQEFSKNLRK